MTQSGPANNFAHMRGRTLPVYGIGLIISSSLFILVNHFHRLPMCADCFRPHGVPFTYYRDGGFAGGGGIVWPGVIADLLSVVALAALLAHVWQLWSDRHSK